MKRIWKILIAVGAVLVVAVIVVILSLDYLAKAGLEKGGTMVLGTPTTARSLDLRLLAGSLTLDGFAVRDPEGYGEGDLVKLETAEVGLKIGSLLSDTVEVKQIILHEPVLRIVSKGRNTNLSVVLNHAQQFGGGGEAPSPEAEGPAKKFRVGLVRITDARFEYAAAGAPAVRVSLPEIELKDLSDEQGRPVPLADLFSQILRAMAKSAVEVEGIRLPSEVTDSLREAAAGGQKAIDDAVKAIKSGEEAIKGVSDLLKGLG
ncbi:MAG: DUF748 domain-containing protein, partial [Planctomycetota bacterium]